MHASSRTGSVEGSREAGLALLHGLDGIVDELSREAPVLLLESRPHSCHSSPKLRGRV